MVLIMVCPTLAITDERGFKGPPLCQGTKKPAGAIVGSLYVYRSTNYPLKARLRSHDAWDDCENAFLKQDPPCQELGFSIMHFYSHPNSVFDFDFAKVVILVLKYSYRHAVKVVFLLLAVKSNDKAIWMVTMCFTNLKVI